MVMRIFSAEEHSWLDQWKEKLVQGGIANGGQEARWLLEAAAPGDFSCAEAFCLRRLKGEPLQYILGTAPFLDLDLKVGPGVLVPRPETETLVEIALEKLEILLQEEKEEVEKSAPICLCDLCTGSGAIPLALLDELDRKEFAKGREWRMDAVDLSPEALGYAKENISRYHRENQLSLYQGDLFAPLESARGRNPYWMITANPPYVTAEEYGHLESTVRDYEPRMALEEPGENGLKFFRRMAEECGAFLRKGGYLLSEMGEEQGEAAKRIFIQAGLTEVEILPDQYGKDRFVIGRKK